VDIGSVARTAAREVDVIIVGGGVSGSTLALDLARAGKSVHVVEKYGADAARRNLLNLAPAVGDHLAWLDNGTGELTDALVPIQQFRFDDRVVGGVPRIRAGSEFLHQPEPNPGAKGLLDALIAPPEDPRLWSRTRIEQLEDSLRGFAARHHPDDITFSYDSTLAKIGTVELAAGGSAANPNGALSQATNGVLELLPRGLDHVDVTVRGKDGAEQAVRGKLLVFATGGRNPLGIPPKLSDDVVHFAGGEFPATDDAVVANRIREWSDKIPGPVDRSVNPGKMPLTTIGLTYPNDRSIVWAQLANDAKSYDPAQLKDVLRERAAFVGMPGELVGEPIPVKVQLGGIDRAAFPEQRIMLIGDELGPPYFPTSSGAAKGVAVAAPLASEHIVEALRPGANLAEVLGRYETKALDAHRKVLAISETQVHHDLHVLGSELPFDLPRTVANR
jgi:hypothetical protein